MSKKRVNKCNPGENLANLARNVQGGGPVFIEEVLEEKVPTSSNGPKLTKNQLEVLHLISVEGMNEKQIAHRRGTSRQAVNLIVQELKLKGYKNLAPCEKDTPVSMKGLANHTSSGKTTLKQWRYHALHFVIKPYYFFPRYNRTRLEKGNYGINYREWVIKLHPDTVEMQLKAGEDFIDVDKWESTRKAEASFNRTLAEIQERYGFKVWKDKKANIRLVNQHLAMNPSEMAQATENFLQIRKNDGRVYFQIDKSQGWEHEYTHPESVLGDSEILEPYLNDFLYSQPPKVSELSIQLSDLAGAITDLAQQSQKAQAGFSEALKGLALGLQAVMELHKGLLTSQQSLIEAITPKKREQNEHKGPYETPSYIG